jgi:tape measure domain-containing protein
MTTGRTVEEMRVVMDAETARLHRKLNEADRRMAQFQRDTAERLRRFDGYFRNAGGAIASLTAGLGTGQILAYADSWKRLERTIQASEDVFGMRLHTSEELLARANEARVSVEAYTVMYTRSAAAIRDYGGTAEDAARITSTLSMALKLGASSAQEQEQTLRQFSQALNKGKLDGDEFRTVMEAAPIVVDLLTTKLKISKGELLAWAEEGKLKIPQLLGALKDGGAKIERIFKQMPVTMDEAMAVLSNSVTGYIGRLDKATGATAKIASGLGVIARNIDTVGHSALVASAAILAAFGPGMIAGIVGFAGGAATAIGPLRLIAAIVGGGAAAIQLFGDQIGVSADGMVTLRDTAQAVIDVIGAKLTPMLKVAGEVWRDAVEWLTKAMDGVPVTWEGVAAATRKLVNTMIGLFMYAGKAIVAAFQTVPAAIGEQMIVMANGVIDTIESMVRNVASALAMIPGIRVQTEIDLGRLTNPLEGAGSRAKQAMAEAGDELGKDFVGAAGAAIGGLREEIAARAREVAEFRKWAEGTKVERAIEIKKPQTPVDQDLLKKMKAAGEELRELHRKSLDAAGRYTEAVGLEYVKELRKFQELLDKKIISQQEFELARQRIAAVSAKEMYEALEKEWKRIREVTDIASSAMEDAFSKFTESGKLDFRDMARSMLADLAKLTFKMAVLKPLFGASGEGFGYLGTLLGGLFGGTGGTIAGRAVGGPVSANTPYIVGERGRELFVPQVSGSIVPANKVGSATSVGVTIAIDARGATRDTLPALERQVAELKGNLPRIIAETVNEGRDRGVIR